MCTRDYLHLSRLFPLSSLLHLLCVVYVFILLTPFTSPSMEFIAVFLSRGNVCSLLLSSFMSLPTEFTAAPLLCGMRFLYCLHRSRRLPWSSFLCIVRVVTCARDCLNILRLYPLSSLLLFFSGVCVFILLTHFTSTSMELISVYLSRGNVWSWLLTYFTSLPTEFTAALLLCGMRFYTAYTVRVAFHGVHRCVSFAW